MLFLLGYQFLTSLTTLLIDIKNIVPNSQRKYFLYIFHYLPPIQNNIFIFEFPHSPGIQINFSHQIIVLLWFLLPISTRNIRKSYFFDQKKINFIDMLTSGQTTALLTYCRPMAIQMRKDKRTPTSHCKTSKTKQAKKKQKCMPHPNDCLKSRKLGH